MEFNNKKTNLSIIEENLKTISYRKENELHNRIETFTSNTKRGKSIINLKTKLNSNTKIRKQKIKLFPELQLKLEKRDNNKKKYSDLIINSEPNKKIKNKKHSLRISRNENLSAKSNLLVTFKTLVNIKRKMITLKASKSNSPPKTSYHNKKINNHFLSNIENKNIIKSYHKKNDSFSDIKKINENKIKRRITRKKLEVIQTIDNHIKYIHKIRDKEMLIIINKYRKEMNENKRIEINHFCNNVFPTAMIQYLIKAKNNLTIDKYRNVYLNKIDSYKTNIISKFIKDNNIENK